VLYAAKVMTGVFVLSQPLALAVLFEHADAMTAKMARTPMRTLVPRRA
jgi:hypothetical protein